MTDEQAQEIARAIERGFAVLADRIADQNDLFGDETMNGPLKRIARALDKIADAMEAR